MSLSFAPLPEFCDRLVSSFKPCSVLVRCNGTNVYRHFENIAEVILNMDVRDDDTWICTFPKSGTTWSEEMVWCIKHGLNNGELNTPHIQRIPFLEFQVLNHSVSMDDIGKECCGTDPRIYFQSVEYVENMKSPRTIKTHLPFSLLPLQIQNGIVKPKIVHVSRDPMDTCVSYYHHCQTFWGFQGTLNEFATLLINDAVYCAPFWTHYFGYVEKRKQSNILFLKYEDMVKDLPSVIRKTAAYLGKDISTNEIAQLCVHLSFGNMKANPYTNMEDVVRVCQKIRTIRNTTVDLSKATFLRKGTSGQWKTLFSEELIRRFKLWTDDNQRCELVNIDL